MVFTLLGCTDPWSGYTFITGVLPDSPVNLDAFNTIFQGSLSFLNSQFNDLYPSFNTDYSRIYFCSDREEGIFNIFSADVDYAGDSIIRVLTDVDPHEVVLNEVLSGEYEDKCPYIFQNLLVFTSNRPGGYGGFDLYYVGILSD